MVRPVGRVEIHDDIRVPPRQQADEGACLRGIELHEVAIEVEPLRVLARTDAGNRAVLLAAGSPR